MSLEFTFLDPANIDTVTESMEQIKEGIENDLKASGEVLPVMPVSVKLASQADEEKIFKMARAYAHIRHDQQFDRAENIDNENWGHTQPFDSCGHELCTVCRR